MRKCAILLSGGIGYEYNYERYRNDLNLAHNVLKKIAGFSDENIFLFYGDGMGYFADAGIAPQAAGKSQLLSCLKELQHELSEDDEFVFVVSNHGGNEEDGNICLWGHEYITLSNLCEYLDKVKAKKLIILGECFAGNILNYSISNSCIFTANERNKPSYACLRTDYDEFLYHFFSYVLGYYPDTKIRIPLGNNNLIEAYQFAKRQDAFCPDNERREKILVDGNEITEIPQIKNNLKGLSVKF